MPPADVSPRCGICAAIDRIRARKFDDFIAELPHGWLILGDQQRYRGYCIVFAKTHAREMYELARGEAAALMDETIRAAEAIAAVTHPWKMNYACLGNQEPHVHWHLHPRYEDDAMRHGPVWINPEYNNRVSLADADRRELIAAIRHEIGIRIPDAIFARD